MLPNLNNKLPDSLSYSNPLYEQSIEHIDTMIGNHPNGTHVIQKHIVPLKLISRNYMSSYYIRITGYRQINITFRYHIALTSSHCRYPSSPIDKTKPISNKQKYSQISR